MENTDKYQVNYWAGGENYEYQDPKPKRSIKRKLAIVLSFILVLAVTPSLIFALSNIDFNDSPKVSLVTENKEFESGDEPTPVNLKVTIEEPKIPENQTEIINNDSYWKISKRVCGDGKFYLSIQSQNGSKALYKGDTVTASCVL